MMKTLASIWWSCYCFFWILLPVSPKTSECSWRWTDTYSDTPLHLKPVRDCSWSSSHLLHSLDLSPNNHSSYHYCILLHCHHHCYHCCHYYCFQEFWVILLLVSYHYCQYQLVNQYYSTLSLQHCQEYHQQFVPGQAFGSHYYFCSQHCCYLVCLDSVLQITAQDSI